ncbi:LPXTG cell wall anchor domain-containing protein, partial [Dietzia sp. DQ11-38-2]
YSYASGPSGPSTPADPAVPGTGAKVGRAGEPGVRDPRTATAGGVLGDTGADVSWLTGAAAVMILGGTLALGLARRNRRSIPETTRE